MLQKDRGSNVDALSAATAACCNARLGGSGAGVGEGTSDASAKVPDHFAFKVFFDYGRSGGSDEFLMVQLSGLQRDAPCYGAS